MFWKGGFGSLTQALRDPGLDATMGFFSLKKMATNWRKVFQKVLQPKVIHPQPKQPLNKSWNTLQKPTTVVPSSRFGNYLRKYGVQTLARYFRNRAAVEFSRNRRPIFSFVAALLTHSQTNEDISSKIQDVFTRKKSPSSDVQDFNNLSLKNFEVGHLIGQGCNSAVYEANFKGSDNISFLDTNSSDEYPLSDDEVVATDETDFVIITVVETDSDGFVEVDDHPDDQVDNNGGKMTDPAKEYHFAIKMMFNYDIESKSEAIYQGMIKEITPVKNADPLNTNESSLWMTRNRVRLKQLPPHPNIVAMHGIFVDSVPKLENDIDRYPAALPHRLNPQTGLGRNRTLFLVMEKYEMTLKAYLSQSNISIHSRCTLLVQLLEAVVHMVDNGISHRDLKSDNILVSVCDGSPHLVVSDFGCCLAEPDYGLVIPFQTWNVDRGGNAALMSPEISNARPGSKTTLDYRKADLWTVGTLVYEIFGAENPFYKGPLDSSTYKEEDLPELPKIAPETIRKLTRRLLQKNPEMRPTPKEAANIVQTYLNFPDWLLPNNLPSEAQMRESVILFAATFLLNFNKVEKKNLTTISFLQRIDFQDIFFLLEEYHMKW